MNERFGTRALVVFIAEADKVSATKKIYFINIF